MDQVYGVRNQIRM